VAASFSEQPGGGMLFQFLPPGSLSLATLPRERGRDKEVYATPSFFCRLVDEVVYWNTSRLSG
jgi:hypothetical protein